ncbi:MAG: hypothetical protein ABR579_05435 [Actinomycetota bacterium]
MTVTRWLPAAAAIAALLAACSSSPTAPPVTSAASASPGPGSSVHPSKAPAHHHGDRSSISHGKDRSGDYGGGHSSKGGGTTTGSPGGKGTKHSSTVAAAPDYPAAGTYVYSQSGTEEFCSGGRCDNQQLPPTQREQTKITGQDSGHTTIVSEIRSADGRYVRTTFDYSRAVAAITEVYYSVNYDGFSFSDDYTPSPAVRSILWPLSVGKSWSGSWDAKTSGTYAMKVASSETVNVGGHATRTFRLDTNEHFSGEYKGTAAVTVWIDPATKAVVKTSGALRLANSLGSYDTNFTTLLQHGPGY